MARAAGLLRAAHRLGAIQRCAGDGRDVARHAAGRAPRVAGAAFGRAGQDVPSAQVAGHRRAGDRHGALALGQGHQMGRGMGLAYPTAARAAPACRESGPCRGHAARLARPRRRRGRVGVLRSGAAHRAGAGQALSVPAVRQDAPVAGRGLPGAGLPHRGAGAVELLVAADRLAAGPAGGRRHGISRAGTDPPRGRAPHRSGSHRFIAALSRAARAGNAHPSRRPLARAPRGAIRLRHLRPQGRRAPLHHRIGVDATRPVRHFHHQGPR